MLTSHLSALVELFNTGKTDLPDGTVHKECVFRLNGRAYHESLGRPSSDPLVRLIGCGPAGYRFVMAAVRYAMPDAMVTLGDDIEERRTGQGFDLTVPVSLSGSPRDARGALRSEAGLVLHADGMFQIREIAVTMNDEDVARIRGARSL